MSIYWDNTILWTCLGLTAVLGAVLGSFLNCAAYRTARGESFVRGRSHCPACGHVLSAPDLVPVLSWVFLRGRCRHCGERVSARYPLTELAFAALSAACLLRFDLSALFLRNWIFLACLFFLALVDLDSYTIPDGCLIVAAGAWALSLPFLRAGWRDALLCILSGVVCGAAVLLLSLVMDKILKKESLGGGDVKLFAVAGLYLGPAGTLFAVVFACLAGLLLAALLKRGRGQPFPFGPAIALAAAGMLLFGDALTAWYLGLF